MIKTEAGEKMKEKNPNKALPEKADINNDGEFQEWEKARHEAIQAAKAEDTPEMNCGGLMGDGMGVIVGIEATSGNEIPAGSKPEEVADDIPAMLSEGEYVVPADVVRWHGVKTFEALRGEAKMGMGLMAQDGRIAEVDDDTKKPVDYDIEEKDKPKMEHPEVKVVEAAEGTDVQPAPDPTIFYQLRYVTDPVTGQLKMAYVDPATGQEVSPSEFEEERASRFAPQNVLQREGLMGEEEVEEAIEEATEEETACPPGFVRSATTGACVPISVEQGGDGVPEQESLFDQTRDMAETLGATYADDPEAALERATRENKALGMKTAGGIGGVLGAPLLGVVVNEAVRYADAVGAQRALLGREQYLGISSNIRGEEITPGTYAYAGPQTYNFTMRDDGTIEASTGGARISEISTTDDGRDWASDYTHVDKDGNEIDPFSSDAAFDSFLESIGEADDDDDPYDSSDVTSAGSTPPSDEATTDAQGAAAAGASYSSEKTEEDYDSEDNEMNKGGYVARKNKPRVAMMKY